jgi:hypothetical protein
MDLSARSTAMRTRSTTRARVLDVIMKAMPADALCSIASSSDARGVACMMSTCRLWRDVLAENEEIIWRALALRDFPLLSIILEVSASQPHSWKAIYRVQPRCDDPLRVMAPPPAGSLSDYIFTAQLEKAEGRTVFPIGQWGGEMRSASQEVVLWSGSPPQELACLLALIVLPNPSARERRTINFTINSLRLVLFVTRKHDMSTICLFKSFNNECALGTQLELNPIVLCPCLAGPDPRS